ncbi:MAG: hypothetical protein ACOC95_05860 [Planctomycetota bacterium]
MFRTPTPQQYNKVTLETSLKAFLDLSDAGITATCTRLWTNWEKLIDRAETVAVLLWTGDGSEIFQWRGMMDDAVPVAQSIGFCNYKTPGAFPPDNRHYRVNAAVPYVDNPPTVTYADLKRIIAELRAVAKALYDLDILVGATIDPGPEFVENDWKFVNHPEILTPDGPRRFPNMMHFLTHQSRFHADDLVYAAFPDGLPEGLPLGTFLGRQFAHAAKTFSYDYIWLSNGFAYTHCPWGFRGELFVGDRFLPEKADGQRKLANTFWKDFRAECDLPVEVRGTNFSVGMDLSSDGCSHVDINRIGKLEVMPTNPPWGSRALGMEMITYLTRIAKTPTARIPFRFYLNDPWFNSTPWYDYYGRETFDLYVPMSVARLNADGTVGAPTDLALLTIDTERGELLTDQANESIPHMIRAVDERADAAGPVVWVYPFDEYDAVLKKEPEKLGHLFFGDWFMVQLANAGLPVNTVCGSDVFVNLAKAGRLPDATYIAPVPAGDWAYEQHLLDLVKRGGRVMLYGALAGASPAVRRALGVKLDEPLEGDFSVKVRLTEDRFARPPQPPTGMDAFGASIGMREAVEAETPDPGKRPLRHRGLISGGGLRAVVNDWADPAVQVVASRKRRKRAYAISRTRTSWKGGRLGWIRGTVSFDPFKNMLEGTPDQPWNVRRPDDWARRMLAEFGLDIIQERLDEGTRTANVFIKRWKGAWVFVGHKPNTTARLWVKTADGAPVFPESETPLRDGYAGDCFGKTLNAEVRCFVKMRDGIVQAKEMPTLAHGRRQLSLANLDHATVTIYPDPVALTDGSLKLTSVITSDDLVPCTVDKERGCVTVKDHTGMLYVAW